MRLFLRVVIVLSVVLVLSACGGGGGGRSFSLPDMVPDVTPMPDPEPEPEPTPTVTTSFQTIDAPSASEVSEYLRIHASGGPWWAGTPGDPGSFTWSRYSGLTRFSTTPTVLLDSRVTEHERAVTYYAVSLINNVLPYDQHILIREDAVQDSRTVSVENVPRNSVLIVWHPESGESYADLDYDWVGDRKIRMASSLVNTSEGPEYPVTLIHELLHALGLEGHVPITRFPTSYLTDTRTDVLMKLDDVEASAVNLLYTQLDERSDTGDLTASSLGQWDQRATVFSGSTYAITNYQGPDENGISSWSEEVIRFGVTMQNGIVQPWVSNNDFDSWQGYNAVALSDNPQLIGTVTWDGGLVGVTTDRAYVQGQTSIDVDIAALTGTAAFTNLEFWDGMPQEVGTGTQWKTGQLAYDLMIENTFLRSTGGDAGTVNGVFYGPDHNTVGGTLERADLTAAFGAARE